MSDSKSKLGFIGLGIMGKPMTLNLIKAGYTLYVYGRRRVSMEPLIAAGAMACAAPREIAEQTDITFVMVADTSDVEEVINGIDGYLSGARQGAIVVDMSTISPLGTRAIAKRLAERGVEM